MFGFGKNRPVMLDVEENSIQEQGLMELFKKHEVEGIKCELGCLFGRTSESGEFMNRYIMSQADFRKIYSDIKTIGTIMSK